MRSTDKSRLQGYNKRTWKQLKSTAAMLVVFYGFLSSRAIEKRVSNPAFKRVALFKASNAAHPVDPLSPGTYYLPGGFD